MLVQVDHICSLSGMEWMGSHPYRPWSHTEIVVCFFVSNIAKTVSNFNQNTSLICSKKSQMGDNLRVSFGVVNANYLVVLWYGSAVTHALTNTQSAHPFGLQRLHAYAIHFTSITYYFLTIVIFPTIISSSTLLLLLYYYHYDCYRSFKAVLNLQAHCSLDKEGRH